MYQIIKVYEMCYHGNMRVLIKPTVLTIQKLKDL